MEAALCSAKETRLTHMPVKQQLMAAELALLETARVLEGKATFTFSLSVDDEQPPA